MRNTDLCAHSMAVALASGTRGTIRSLPGIDSCGHRAHRKRASHRNRFVVAAALSVRMDA